jgi:hypothetical protein
VSDVAKFDFSVTFLYNSTSNDDRLCCQFECSQDLFDERTVKKMGQRFEYLLSQLFVAKSDMMEVEVIIKPMRQLSLILPEDAEVVCEVIFTHVPNVIVEGMVIRSLKCHD